MGSKLKTETEFLINGITKSYAQVFFSDNRWLAVLILLASFIDPYAGFAGLFTVIASILFAVLLGFNRSVISSGTYSYNALLVGLSIGVFFKMSLPLIILLLLASLLVLLITVWLSGVTAAYKVPFLSLPFMISVWILIMSGRSLTALALRGRDPNSFNQLGEMCGTILMNINEKIENVGLPGLIMAYLKSLGAILFESNVVAGALISIGILIYSRIAFSLSLIGFLAGYAFCLFFQGNVNMSDYTYIGFNYILASIAIGGFFLVPSASSYLLAIVMVPIIGLFTGALSSMLNVFFLPVYSLPFSVVVILIIYVLLNRYSINKLKLVQFQQFSPEKNLYSLQNANERFKNDTYFHIGLPFYGEWRVSQAHEGSITHKEDWRYAWDFVVTDETQKTFKWPGKEVTDFYCYNLPVLAAAAGYVVKIVDGIEDNHIGDANIADNWGNSIVIKHGDYLYSQISHIKKGSFKCRVGDYVKKGDILALCGNSGRSPEPHIHFQLQAIPDVGAKTLKYPFGYYVAKENTKSAFHSFDYPTEGQVLTKVVPTALIQSAFHFPLGKVMEFKVSGKKTENVKWEVFVDIYNNPYIYCYNTGSYAYFANNETLHYFTSFKGDTKSLLYYFYIGAHKVLMSYSNQFEVKDMLNAEDFVKGPMKFVQDFVAPFNIFMKSEYVAKYTGVDEESDPKHIKMDSYAVGRTGSTVNRRLDFEMEIANNRIEKFTIKEKNTCVIAEHIS